MALTVTPAELTATALTLTTAAQPNITSVGTLTGLTVSGNIAGTLTTAAQTNITSLGTLTGLTVSGNLIVDTTTLVVDATNNRVGAGVASPQSNMHVLGTLKVATGNAQGILGLGEGAGTTVNVGLWRGAANNPTSDGNFLNLGGYDGIVFAASAAAIGSQTERMRLTSGGILQIAGGGNDNVGEINFGNTAQNANRLQIRHQSSAWFLKTVDSEPLLFGTANTERMRINSVGDWMVSNTVANVASNYSAQGGCGWVESDNHFEIATTSNRTALEIGKNNANDGAIINFRKQSTIVGNIGTNGGFIYIEPQSSGNGLTFLNTSVSPCTSNGGVSDNFLDLGTSSRRFKDLYRSGSTYSTSDRNMKQDIRDLTDAERNVAVAAKGLLKAFRFIDRVEEAGDSASIHFGIIAQDLAAAFTAEGLDPNDYQVYKSATTTDEDGNEQTRLNVCYENLLAFIIAAI